MRFLFILTTLFALVLTFGQAVGAKQKAMASCSLTSSDPFSATNSIAASCFAKENQLGLFFQNSFLFPEINTTNLSFTQALRSGAMIYKIDLHFGYANFNTLNAGLGYAHQFGERLGIGLRFNYHRLSIPEQGSKNAISFDMGLFYAFNEKFRLALCIRNPAKQKLEPLYKETLPTNFLIGTSFHPNEKITLAWEFQKDMQFPLRASIGMDYLVHPKINIRTGMSINPFLISGGMGFSVKPLQIDLSSSWDVNLGYSPQISLSYAFTRKNNKY